MRPWDRWLVENGRSATILWPRRAEAIIRGLGGRQSGRFLGEGLEQQPLPVLFFPFVCLFHQVSRQPCPKLGGGLERTHSFLQSLYALLQRFPLISQGSTDVSQLARFPSCCDLLKVILAHRSVTLIAM